MKDQKFVTYYIGAGASANCLPCVNQIPKRIEELIAFCKETELPKIDRNYTLELNSYKEWSECKAKMISDLQELYDRSKEYATIDTYAKKLYLTIELDEYNKLLHLLSFFFVTEQIINRPDKRYDTFFANVLQRGDSFPDNINILSWNYDSQFEIAHAEYKRQHAITVGTKQVEYYQKYRLINLNGVASFKNMGYDIAQYRKEILKKVNPFSNDKEDKTELLYRIIVLYFDYVYNCTRENVTSLLSFAFEGEYGLHNELYRRIDEIMEKTDALVIIGYTFPFFNRSVDRRILSKLKSSAKIYIQDIDDKGRKYVKQNFQATLNNDSFDNQLILLESADQFYLPPEL